MDYHRVNEDTIKYLNLNYFNKFNLELNNYIYTYVETVIHI